MPNTLSPETSVEMLPTTDRALVRWQLEGMVRLYQAIAELANGIASAKDDEERKSALLSLVMVGAATAKAADKVDAYLNGAESQLPSIYFEEPVTGVAPTQEGYRVAGSSSVN